MTLGIIAGNGDLPKLLISESIKKKEDFVLILISGNSNYKEYEEYNPATIEIGQVSSAISILKKNKVDKVIFAGGVKKPSFSDIKVDKKGAILLSKILASKIFGDDKVLSVVTDFFLKEGFKVLGVHEIVDGLILKKGVLTKAKPDKQDLDNIRIGEEAIQLMSSLDIGQSIAVHQKQIIGVEAIEGTDSLIERCKSLRFSNNKGPILVKISKKNQNRKIDLPTIGEKTIKNLAKSKFSGIAIKSGSVIVVDKEKVISAANKEDLFIIAI